MFDSVAVSFVVYTVAIVGLGLYSARFSKQTAVDFFLADRGLGAWVAAISSSASAESGWVTLGLVGMAYKTGIGAMWVVFGTFIAFLFNWFVLAWRLRSRAAEFDALTIPDVLAAPFRGWPALLIRIMGVLIILAMLTAYVAAQLNAAGKTFNGTFGWDYLTGVLVGAAIVLLYTVTGGFRAIAWTDVVQGTFMVITVTVLPAILIWKIGGLAAFWQQLSATADGATLTDPFGGRSGLALIGFLALWLGVPLGNPGQPHVLVRLMAVKDRTAVLRGGVISSLWVLLLFSGAVALGMAARVYFGEMADPEQTLPRIARDASIVPGFLGGMIIAAVLAAICSTADSQLLVSASAVSHDLIVRILKWDLPAKTRMILDRSAVILVGNRGHGNRGGGSAIRVQLRPRLRMGRARCRFRTSSDSVSPLASHNRMGSPCRHERRPDHGDRLETVPHTSEHSCYNLVPAFAFSVLSIVLVSWLTAGENRSSTDLDSGS